MKNSTTTDETTKEKKPKEMKLPTAIKPFSVAKLVKNAPPLDSSYENFDHMTDLFILTQWAEDFRRETKDATGTFVWDPNMDDGLPTPFEKYKDAFKAAQASCRWSMENKTALWAENLIKFFGQFATIYNIIQLIDAAVTASKKKTYTGVPVTLKGVCYKFEGDFTTSLPHDFSIMFTVGNSNYTYKVSNDFTKIKIVSVETVDMVDEKDEVESVDIGEHFKSLLNTANETETVGMDCI